MKVGIIADDLTGAADSLAPFARRGWKAVIGFELKSRPERFVALEGDAAAYDVATRDMPREQQAAITLTIGQAARLLAEAAPKIAFKKIDSTLRGHLRWELDAMRAEFPGRIALVCPAFPAQKRTVQNGILHIHNVPWTATEFAPKSLFTSRTVRSAFGMDGDASAAELTVDDIRQDADSLEAQLQTWRERGMQTVFCDATLPSDLDILAQLLLRNPKQYLPVGSAGLARALAEAMPQVETNAPGLEHLEQPFVNGRILVIVGSLHAASRRQALELSGRLKAPPIEIALSENSRQQMEHAVEQICERYQQGASVVVLITPGAPNPSSASEFALLSGRVARHLLLWGAQTGMNIDGLAISGGDTAKAICQACGGTGLQVTGEWEPGMALSRLLAETDVADGVSFDGLSILTKAGGFGDDGTLVRCVGLL